MLQPCRHRTTLAFAAVILAALSPQPPLAHGFVRPESGAAAAAAAAARSRFGYSSGSTAATRAMGLTRPARVVDVVVPPRTITSVSASSSETSIASGVAHALRGGDATTLSRNSIIAGRIFPALSKLAISRKTARKIASSLSSEVHVGEIAFVAALGLGSIPVARAIYGRFFAAKGKEGESGGGESSEEGRPFKRTRMYLAAKLLERGSQIATAVYAVDIIDIILSDMGFRYFQRNRVAEQFARVAYLVWSMLLVKDFKKHLLDVTVKRRSSSVRGSGAAAGKVAIYDRLINAVLFLATFLGALDVLKVNMGMAISSVLSLGGISTLVFSLASKDLAEQLVSGLVISTQERFYEGDEINLGDGTAGIVSKIGWMHTDIRGYDEKVVSMPNSLIVNQKVTNLSRTRRSQVKQALWFSYDDIDKMSAVCRAIKEEISSNCPELIRQGRPFFSHWREYGDDHLELVVDCHFEVPPIGSVYYDNRQRVLEAIARAVKKCGVNFALPTYAFVTDGQPPASMPPPQA